MGRGSNRNSCKKEQGTPCTIKTLQSSSPYFSNLGLPVSREMISRAQVLPDPGKRMKWWLWTDPPGEQMAVENLWHSGTPSVKEW